jgi:hypothetical protein
MTREGMADTGGLATFIVRITRVDGGGLSALVERVRTGEKTRVQAVESLGRVLIRMLDAPVDGDVDPETRAEPSSPGVTPGNQEERQP